MINLDTRLLDKLPEVGADSFAILLLITKRINKDSQSFPSVETLQKESGFGRNKVFKCLKTLKEHGLLESKQRRKNNKLTSNIYTMMAEGLGVFIPAKGVEMEESVSTQNEYTETNQQNGSSYQNNSGFLCTYFEDTENEDTQNQTRSINNTSLSIKQSSLSINENEKKDSPEPLKEGSESFYQKRKPTKEELRQQEVELYKQKIIESIRRVCEHPDLDLEYKRKVATERTRFRGIELPPELEVYLLK